MLVEAAAGRPAYVLPTAAARQDPARAVRTAAGWFFTLDCAVQELPVLSRHDAQSPDLAERVADAGLIYLVGGDPGHLLRTLQGSAVWRAIERAWRAGAALAGSSAGAMVLGDHVLLRARWPNHHRRRAVPGLGLVPHVAVIPHADTSGHRWTLAPAAVGAPSAPPSHIPNTPGVQGIGQPSRTPKWPDGAWSPESQSEGPRLLRLDERTAAVWIEQTGWRALGPGRVVGIEMLSSPRT